MLGGAVLSATVRQMRHLFGLDLEEVTSVRLISRARQLQMPMGELAGRYVEEGLRMDEHQRVLFRDGPAGRRAGLAGGLDVWEMIMVVQAHDGDVGASADYLELPVSLVQSAVSYYEAYPDEINERISNNERLGSERAEAARLASGREADNTGRT